MFGHQFDHAFGEQLLEGVPCQRATDLQPLRHNSGGDELVVGNFFVQLVVGRLVEEDQVVELIPHFSLGPLLLLGFASRLVDWVLVLFGLPSILLLILFRRLKDPSNYPVSIRFGRARLSSNEKLMLASMFHSLFAIGSQLSPEVGSSGIEMLETDVFKLHCFQTLTGIKFIVLADPRQSGIDALLRKIYEVYSDFALKNPFYSLEMPIRCELFDQNLKSALEVAEKAGNFGAGS